MSLMQYILEDHEKFLKRLGYDEQNIESPFRKGWMIHELKLNLSKAIHEMFYDDSPTDFSLKAVGFFNNNTDVVRFKFHYRFDPVKAALELKQLEIFSIIDRKEASVNLKSINELPSLSKALALVGKTLQKRKSSEEVRKIKEEKITKQGRRL